MNKCILIKLLLKKCIRLHISNYVIRQVTINVRPNRSISYGANQVLIEAIVEVASRSIVLSKLHEDFVLN